MPAPVIVFGEVLYDCFPSGERVMGGAPFNVAWHLQALGDEPLFISRVGEDESGRDILRSAEAWGMDISHIRQDTRYPTGTVTIEFRNNEPGYTIKPDCAYDFIEQLDFSQLFPGSILYHGTLALRNQVSRVTLSELIRQRMPSIFLDVNLRTPWWQLAEVNKYLAHARWVKLNVDELERLGFSSTDRRQAMADLQARFPIEMLILTQGEKGAIVRMRDGSNETLEPEPTIDIVDTVGAGDAFSAMFIHGLHAGWPLKKILFEAQRFALSMIKIRGAIPETKDYYRDFLT